MPLAVDCYVLGPFMTNCYVVRAGQRATEAVVVDPGASGERLLGELTESATTCAAILVTHGDADHIGAVADLAEGSGAAIYAPAVERISPLRMQGEWFGAPSRAYEPTTTLEGGETFAAAGISFEVLAIPGHSPDHLAYHADGSLFAGDLLMQQTVGRVDVPGGNWGALLESVAMLFERFPPETVVYPGHGDPTTLGFEQARNPFLAELRAS